MKTKTIDLVEFASDVAARICITADDLAGWSKEKSKKFEDDVCVVVVDAFAKLIKENTGLSEKRRN